MSKLFYSLTFGLFLPSLVSAANPVQPGRPDSGLMPDLPPGGGPTAAFEGKAGLMKLLGWLSEVLSTYVIPVVITLALVLFLFGLLKYVTAGADEEKRTAGRNLMIYGIIALFVMVSVWGLVAILNRTFGIGQGGRASGTPSGTLLPSNTQGQNQRTTQ